MDKLLFLGTGAAMNPYCNTTAVLHRHEGGMLLIDSSGGQNILLQLAKARISPLDLTDVVISHLHSDHICGLPWLFRAHAHGRSSRPLSVWATPAVLDAALAISRPILPPQVLAEIGKSIRFMPVKDGDEIRLAGRRYVLFDSGARKTPQMGVYTPLGDGSGLTFCGDEPLRAAGMPYACRSVHLVHDAFCSRFDAPPGLDPHDIGHSTVADAAANAAAVGARHLILFHAHGAGGLRRKWRYRLDAVRRFRGRVSVPDDGETVTLVP